MLTTFILTLLVARADADDARLSVWKAECYTRLGKMKYDSTTALNQCHESLKTTAWEYGGAAGLAATGAGAATFVPGFGEVLAIGLGVASIAADVACMVTWSNHCAGTYADYSMGLDNKQATKTLYDMMRTYAVAQLPPVSSKAASAAPRKLGATLWFDMENNIPLTEAEWTSVVSRVDAAGIEGEEGWEMVESYGAYLKSFEEWENVDQAFEAGETVTEDMFETMAERAGWEVVAEAFGEDGAIVVADDSISVASTATIRTLTTEAGTAAVEAVVRREATAETSRTICYFIPFGIGAALGGAITTGMIRYLAGQNNDHVREKYSDLIDKHYRIMGKAIDDQAQKWSSH